MWSPVLDIRSSCDKLSTYCNVHDNRKKIEMKLIVFVHRLVRLDVDFFLLLWLRTAERVSMGLWLRSIVIELISTAQIHMKYWTKTVLTIRQINGTRAREEVNRGWKSIAPWKRAWNFDVENCYVEQERECNLMKSRQIKALIADCKNKHTRDRTSSSSPTSWSCLSSDNQ
jgi:hypothetical protein